MSHHPPGVSVREREVYIVGDMGVMRTELWECLGLL